MIIIVVWLIVTRRLKFLREEFKNLREEIEIVREEIKIVREEILHSLRDPV